MKTKTETTFSFKLASAYRDATDLSHLECCARRRPLIRGSSNPDSLLPSSFMAAAAKPRAHRRSVLR